ncbi:hypothetical protein T484DRAFT_1924694 [Baffinella frigidus]|nr:hypothetical protein T484DRAFT_1924694 [Cryptophyta sp. CCMP2293]
MSWIEMKGHVPRGSTPTTQPGQRIHEHPTQAPHKPPTDKRTNLGFPEDTFITTDTAAMYAPPSRL